MRVSLIVAHDEGGVIAVDGRIPWDLPEERSYFRRVTLGHVVVMGRATWETLPAPLDWRTNVVLTRDVSRVFAPRIEAKFNAFAAMSLDDALRIAGEMPPAYVEVFIAGGAGVYRAALDAGVVERICATEVHARYDGDDVRRFATPAGWRCVEEGVRREATTTRPAWTPRVWRRA